MFYLTSESAVVRENAEHVGERVIQAIWNYLFLRITELKTIDGQNVRILDQGAWNHDAGPDFLDAKIRIGDTVHIGHVEIHHQTSDWGRHGHDADRRYDRVILHVVMDHDGKSDSRPVLEIRPFLADRLERLIERLDDLDGLNIFCHDNIARIDEAIVQKWVADSGWQRFLQKAESFAADQVRMGRSWESLMYEGMCEALGYSANRSPFRRLARLVPLELLRRDWPSDPAVRLMTFQSLLLGAAGLLDDATSDVAEAELIPFVNRLQSIWAASAETFKRPLKAADWKLSRMRPANFPILRIAGLARLLSQNGNDLLSPFEKALLKTADVATAWTGAIQILHVPSFGYWSRHYRFNDRGQRGAHDLIGVQRASEILVNVILPVLYARGSTEDKARVQTLMTTLPSAENNRLIRDMRRQLKLGARKLTLTEGQGLIQLHRRCREMNCSDCPIFEEIVGDD